MPALHAAQCAGDPVASACWGRLATAGQLEPGEGIDSPRRTSRSRASCADPHPAALKLLCSCEPLLRPPATARTAAARPSPCSALNHGLLSCLSTDGTAEPYPCYRATSHAESSGRCRQQGYRVPGDLAWAAVHPLAALAGRQPSCRSIPAWPASQPARLNLPSTPQ